MNFSDLIFAAERPSRPSLLERADKRFMVKWIEGGVDASPDRGSRFGRELLAAHDCSKASVTRFTPPQRRHSRHRKDRREAWVEIDQRIDRIFEIGLRVEMDCH